MLLASRSIAASKAAWGASWTSRDRLEDPLRSKSSLSGPFSDMLLAIFSQETKVPDSFCPPFLQKTIDTPNVSFRKEDAFFLMLRRLR